MKLTKSVLILVVLLMLSCNVIPESLSSLVSPEDSSSESAEEATPTPLPANARVVYMLGRSVTGLWFNSWGWEGDTLTPVVRGRYVLFRREIDTPENMVNSVREIVSQIPDGENSTIHWKFCFDDFSAGEEAQSSIRRNEQIVQQVYQIVVEQHRHRLIIGNALPKVTQETDPELVAAQRQYNQWLVQFAGQHPDQVFIFDQYAVLADANGALRSTFASARDDSHPNAAGYRALDTPYFAFLNRILK